MRRSSSAITNPSLDWTNASSRSLALETGSSEPAGPLPAWFEAITENYAIFIWGAIHFDGMHYRNDIALEKTPAVR